MRAGKVLQLLLFVCLFVCLLGNDNVTCFSGNNEQVSFVCSFVGLLVGYRDYLVVALLLHRRARCAIQCCFCDHAYCRVGSFGELALFSGVQI